MKTFGIQLICLATLAVLGTADVASANEPVCVPFEATSISSLVPVDEDTDLIDGEGTGDPIGDYTQSGEVTFVFQGGAILFVSSTTISTADGDLYTREFGSALGGAGTFQVTGGTGLYEGATGHGSFRVIAFDPTLAVQTVRYQGVLCLPAPE
jgi:hypothetical protein